MLAVTKRLSIAAVLALTLGGSLSVPAYSDVAHSQGLNGSQVAPNLVRGDLVRLRSGGPLMTIENVKGDQVDCFWSDYNGQSNAATFPIYVLRKF
jgi:uncharacterized protein YodC (DUF2158 family)